MSSFKHLTVNEAKELIDTQSPQIIDIRDSRSYEVGHINTAVNINGDTVHDFVKTAHKDKPVICYCYHGHSSQSAAVFLVEQGFQDVYSIDGGYEQWKITYEQ